jgi:hypothetical protein
MPEQIQLGLSRPAPAEKDIYLCHNGADKPWVEMLAERIEAQPYCDRYLGVVLDKWDFPKGGNIVLDIERFIDAARFVGIVVSRAMLSAEWPTLERTIAVWSDPSGARGRVITLLRGNVTLPATLRMRNWIDFRDDSKFEQSFAELIRLLRGEATPRSKGSFLPIVAQSAPPYEPAPMLITSSVGADRINERLVSNLYRVTALPEKVYYAPTKMRKKEDVAKYCEHAPPFILREGKLYTFTDLSTSDVFRSALARADSRVAFDQFADWFSDDDYSRRAIELLNVCFKQHAWIRRMRSDSKGRYFFRPLPAERPKRIAWNIGGVRRWREVTTQHMRRAKQEDGTFAKKEDGSFVFEPFGWRHQGIRASFTRVMDRLMLKLEPTYLLTQEDGKTPRTAKWVGPVLSHWLNQERNGQILRSLRFWSLVLARSKELRIETGQSPICVDLTPTSGRLGFGIAADQMNFDRLMEAELADDVEVPQLEFSFGEESAIEYAAETEYAEEEREDEEAPEI